MLQVHEKNLKLQQAGRRGVGARCGFRVLVMGGDAEEGGRRLALRLFSASVETVFIPDAALFSIMPKVDKVLFGALQTLNPKP